MNNIDDLINNLNQQLYESTNDPFPDCVFTYSSDGYATVVKYGDIFIWSSENDDREWIDSKNDYEPLEPFLVNQLKKELFKITNTIDGLIEYRLNK